MAVIDDDCESCRPCATANRFRRTRARIVTLSPEQKVNHVRIHTSLRQGEKRQALGQVEVIPQDDIDERQSDGARSERSSSRAGKAI